MGSPAGAGGSENEVARRKSRVDKTPDIGTAETDRDSGRPHSWKHCVGSPAGAEEDRGGTRKHCVGSPAGARESESEVAGRKSGVDKYCHDRPRFREATLTSPC